MSVLCIRAGCVGSTHRQLGLSWPFLTATSWVSRGSIPAQVDNIPKLTVRGPELWPARLQNETPQHELASIFWA